MGTFHNIFLKPSKTLLVCFFSAEPLKTLDTFRTFQDFCELLTYISDPFEEPFRVVESHFVLGKALWCSSSQRSVLVLSSGSITTSARTVQPPWTLRNMVDAFSKLCKGEKASLTCWNLRGPQQSTAKCSDPQRSLVNLGQHERIPENLAVHRRTSENR